ncbi:hypothetical protein KUH32_11910 [Thalassococcus sp. CAU 1522]|uniref:Sulfotransferase family protein n=1 Tax=Thalassococcus arenae TaxID=2851652 RepID=A0ABS6N9Y6_9RHOB|nr:hypothetical protein [Thalassococcus arenae]MBV2360482.1 hypothetical protein [Thalassococcus arenae]
MDILLHVGAHRCASSSFQAYLRAHRARLDNLGIGFWGPWRTRGGMLHGLTGRPVSPKSARRAAGRVRLNLDATARKGAAVLVVSEENLIGSVRANLRSGQLYPDIGERMARVHAAFGPVRRIVLQIRSPETWWPSAIAYMVPRGGPLPDSAALMRMARQTRGWRHVVSDLACACPETEIVITPYERFGSHPDALLQRLTGALYLPEAGGDFWLNRAPGLPELRGLLADRGADPSLLPQGDGRFQPFDFDQRAALRETYADDLFWLRAGADGLATLTEEATPDRIRLNRAAGATTRGQEDDQNARRLAPTR